MTKLSELEKRIKELQSKCCCKDVLIVDSLPAVGKEGILYVFEEEIYIWDGSTFVSVGFSGEWGSITGTLSNQTDLQSALDAKQVTLVSGTNIKTVNSTSLLGSGDINTLIENITYAALATLITNSGLTAGLKYKITDFATRHFLIQPTATNYQDTSVTFTGVNEALIVTAISTNQIDIVAQSLLYPKDIIYYDWNPANFMSDSGFADRTNATIISDFKGVIYFRHDTYNENSIGYDFRNVKFRRYKSTLSAWSALTTYAAYAYVTSAGGVYVSRAAANLNNAVSDNTKWQRVYIHSDTEYINITPTTNMSFGFATSVADFQDYYTFQPLGTSTYIDFFYKNNISVNPDRFNGYSIQCESILTNNVFFSNSGYDVDVHGNTIVGNYFFNNTIGHYFSNNKIYGCLANCIIGTNFISNKIDDSSWSFDQTLISDGFTENTITNGQGIDSTIIGRLCSNNIISYISGCIIGESCTGNYISYMNLSKVKNNFRYNRIEIGVVVFGSLVPDAATHIYANYNKTIFRNSAGTARLLYYDASDVPTVVNVTV